MYYIWLIQALFFRLASKSKYSSFEIQLTVAGHRRFFTWRDDFSLITHNETIRETRWCKNLDVSFIENSYCEAHTTESPWLCLGRLSTVLSFFASSKILLTCIMDDTVESLLRTVKFKPLNTLCFNLTLDNLLIRIFTMVHSINYISQFYNSNWLHCWFEANIKKSLHHIFWEFFEHHISYMQSKLCK